MVAFQVTDGPRTARCLARDLEIIHYALGLGHHRSFEYWIGTDDLVEAWFGLTGDALDRYRTFAGDGVSRCPWASKIPEMSAATSTECSACDGDSTLDRPVGVYHLVSVSASHATERDSASEADDVPEPFASMGTSFANQIVTPDALVTR